MERSDKIQVTIIESRETDSNAFNAFNVFEFRLSDSHVRVLLAVARTLADEA